jgi:hypothetical protein
MRSARPIVAKTSESSNQEEKTDWGVMKEKICADLKRFIVKETSRRPFDHACDFGDLSRTDRRSGLALPDSFTSRHLHPRP